MFSKRRLEERLRRRGTGVDTHDVGSFRSSISRTTAIRLVAAGGAVALVLAAVASARDPATTERALVPQDQVGVVVVDLSLSIADDDLGAIRRTFRRLIAEESSIGLVVFSDVPYELLPPGTPAAELQPILRLLVPPRLGSIRTPWTQTFRAGTKISVALDLARAALERDKVSNGSILLVSDLETAPDDVPETARVLRSIQREGIQVRLLALGPSSDARALFGGILGPRAFTPLDRAANRSPELTPPGRRPVPQLLLVLGALVFGALAAHERFAGRLALPAATRRAA